MQCRTARTTAAAGSCVRPQKSIYGYAANGLTALAEHQNRVFDHFTEVADHKEIYSRTHFEDSVEIIEQATVGVGPQTWHG